MKENLHPIDEFFKKNLEEHQEIPAAENWEAIDSNLDKNKVISIAKKYNDLKKIAIAHFLIGFIVSVYALYLHRQQDVYLVKYNQNKKPLPTTEKQSTVTLNRQRKLEVVQPVENPSSESNTEEINRSTNSGFNNEAVIKKDRNLATEKSVTELPESSSKPIFSEKESGHKERNNSSFPSTFIANNRKKEPFPAGNVSNTSLPETNLATNGYSRQPSLLLYRHIQNKPIGDQVALHGISDRKAIVNASDNELKMQKIWTKPHGFSLTGFYSADKVDNHLKNDDHSPRRRDRDEFKNNEQRGASFTTGLLVAYKVSQKISIQSGILYSTSTTNIIPKTIYARPDSRGNVRYEFNCSAGYSYINSKSGSVPASGDSAKSLDSKTHLQYLGLPINVQYRLATGRLSISPGVGFIFNHLISGNIGTTIMNGTNTESSSATINGLHSNYLSGALSLEAAFKLNSKLSIVLAPVERMALTSINTNTPVKTYPSIFGISGGVRVSF